MLCKDKLHLKLNLQFASKTLLVPQDGPFKEELLIPFKKVYLHPHSPLLSSFFLFHSENKPSKTSHCFVRLADKEIAGSELKWCKAPLSRFLHNRGSWSQCVSNSVRIRVCDVMCNDMHVVLQRG